MMKTARLLFVLLCALTCSPLLRGQERPVVIPKGEYAIGAQFATLDLDSDNVDYYLIFNPVSAKGRVTNIAPFGEYAYRDDHTAGARIGYTAGSAAVDNITLDLLNEGLQFDMSEVTAGLKVLDATVFQRNYYALDRNSRVALVTEFALSVGHGNTEFTSNDALTRATTFNTKLSFSPGIVFFVMNNISVMGTISMANVSYNKVDCYNDNFKTGNREKFGARIGLDLFGARFGTAFHF